MVAGVAGVPIWITGAIFTIEATDEERCLFLLTLIKVFDISEGPGFELG